ncbi:LysR family transcriptional regulator [Coraliomargarita akajimensis]|uniref:Transcriptional regulator, LysR family n=1 Tax=Coraliomargarita akajimensis (strain DSM 45221 / IAM 15411 / JCM 23193 / KCTC 12865 / 04OKA010-24) TaxID=583355 RepID=D5EMN2_CORAD|nr:LysR family transcriptional regulator [Coraliomargarita akajimensis]ADE53438.1 transcriptional regulator, LysR family [Coraliomargarita akajimensis DSM 45221]
MHVENFKIFSDLVESESFSRAAKLNGITQSAVSQQLRAMEKHFNILIVDRSQKQFRLTREGQKLYESAKEILYLYDKLNSELQEMKKVISGTIHISTVYSIGLHELPPYVKAFMAKYPEVNVRVEYRRANMVYEDILTNSIDLGLVAYPQKHKQLEVLPFHDDQLVLVVSPDHELANSPGVTIEELGGQKFIGFEPDIPTRKATDQIFKEAKVEADPVMEFDNVETVKRAVEINAGIAILPQTTVTREVAQGLLKVVPFKNTVYNRPLALIHRKGRVLTPAIKKLIELLTSKNLNENEADEKKD